MADDRTRQRRSRNAGTVYQRAVVPIGRGGSDGIDNIVLACLACNRAKHAMPVDEFIEWAERTGFFTKPRPWERQ